MSDLRLDLETKRTCFRAQVVAITTGQTEVTTRSMAAAALRTDEARSVCTAAGVPLDGAKALVDEPEFSRVLEGVERSLTEKGDWFGSRSHIASLRPLPASENMRRAFDAMATTEGVTTPVDLLRAVLMSDPELAAVLAETGVTAGVLRRPSPRG